MFSGFLNGVGIGLGFWLIAIVAVLWLRKPSAETKDINERTLESMRERNAIGVREAEALGRIADLIEEFDPKRS
jgi:hypothetical protein